MEQISLLVQEPLNLMGIPLVLLSSIPTIASPLSERSIPNWKALFHFGINYDTCIIAAFQALSQAICSSPLP